MTQPTKEDIHSSDSVKMKFGLLKGVKQSMSILTAKATTGMPYRTTEAMEGHT